MERITHALPHVTSLNHGRGSQTVPSSLQCVFPGSERQLLLAKKYFNAIVKRWRV